MSEENFSYEDFKKISELWLEKNRQQQAKNSSESVNLILDKALPENKMPSRINNIFGTTDISRRFRPQGES